LTHRMRRSVAVPFSPSMASGATPQRGLVAGLARAVPGTKRDMARLATRRGTTSRTGAGATAGRAARKGLWGLARIVSLITTVVVGLIVIGILLKVLGANESNQIVDWLVDAARWLAGPFKNIFDVGGQKATIAVNWGLAALVYALIGGFIARLLRR
jgi:hypothetical protein